MTHYSGNDPATGCGAMILIAALLVALALVVWFWPWR